MSLLLLMFSNIFYMFQPFDSLLPVCFYFRGFFWLKFLHEDTNRDAGHEQILQTQRESASVHPESFFRFFLWCSVTLFFSVELEPMGTKSVSSSLNDLNVDMCWSEQEKSFLKKGNGENLQFIFIVLDRWLSAAHLVIGIWLSTFTHVL